LQRDTVGPFATISRNILRCACAWAGNNGPGMTHAGHVLPPAHPSALSEQGGSPTSAGSLASAALLPVGDRVEPVLGPAAPPFVFPNPRQDRHEHVAQTPSPRPASLYHRGCSGRACRQARGNDRVPPTTDQRSIVPTQLAETRRRGQNPRHTPPIQPTTLTPPTTNDLRATESRIGQLPQTPPIPQQPRAATRTTSVTTNSYKSAGFWPHLPGPRIRKRPAPSRRVPRRTPRRKIRRANRFSSGHMLPSDAILPHGEQYIPRPQTSRSAARACRLRHFAGGVVADCPIRPHHTTRACPAPGGGGGR